MKLWRALGLCRRGFSRDALLAVAAKAPPTDSALTTNANAANKKPALGGFFIGCSYQ
jgi:hypothetical protein